MKKKIEKINQTQKNKKKKLGKVVLSTKRSMENAGTTEIHQPPRKDLRNEPCIMVDSG